MLKKLSCVLIALFIFASAVSVFAESPVKVEIDGEAVNFDVQPTITDGRVLVPMRTIFEAFGAHVMWDDEMKTVFAVLGETFIAMPVGSDYFIRGGERIALDVPAVIAEGRTLVPLRAIAESLDLEVNWNGETRTVTISQPVNVVKVTTPTEFINAINDNTKIVLEGESFNLSDVTEWKNEKVIREEVFDGYEFVILGVSNLEICSEANSELVVTPRYADVLSFKSCKNVKLKGLILGHTTETGYCTGGVVSISDFADFTVEGCRMYGCGTYGIIADNGSNLFVTDSEIYECTYGIMTIDRTDGVSFEKCRFYDCQGFDMVGIRNCGNVKFSQCDFYKNKGDVLLDINSGEPVIFEKCTFENNEVTEFGKGLYDIRN